MILTYVIWGKLFKIGLSIICKYQLKTSIGSNRVLLFCIKSEYKIIKVDKISNANLKESNPVPV